MAGVAAIKSCRRWLLQEILKILFWKNNPRKIRKTGQSQVKGENRYLFRTTGYRDGTNNSCEKLRQIASQGMEKVPYKYKTYTK